MITAILFFITAVLYASVGFGGGSTYNALLVLADTDYRLVPVIALLCNLIVVTGGTVRFARVGALRLDIALPFTLFAVPLAWVGGATAISKATFMLMLGLALAVSAAVILFRPAADSRVRELTKSKLWALGAAIGMPLGFLAGLVGVGGGIFLAPVLYMLRLAPARQIAATASFFILANSLAGLGGQFAKVQSTVGFQSVLEHGWLFVAVLLGGQLGTHAGIRLLSELTVRRLTALLMAYVAARLLYDWALL